ncbi:MAG: malonic semialdehyde reductase [Alphaproteobacteria bacterium]|nr:malonic semialdehyde reductase [Alphaproteobacteria bacterium]
MTALNAPLDDAALDTIFREARTHSNWQDKDVPDTLLKALHDVMKFGPTSANCCPARFVFVKSKDAKARLKPHLDEGNVEKTMKAPVTAIIAYDREFYEKLPKLFPHTDARSWFAGKEKKIEETAFRNSALQGAYLIIAARALGLDCGPMSGFNPEGLQKEFFKGQPVWPNFLCNLGYGVVEKLHPRSPRFAFDEACSIL